jgi:hypothetical protein
VNKLTLLFHHCPVQDGENGLLAICPNNGLIHNLPHQIKLSTNPCCGTTHHVQVKLAHSHFTELQVSYIKFIHCQLYSGTSNISCGQMKCGLCQIKLIHSHFNLVTVNSNPCFIHSTDQASLLRLYTSSEVWIDCNYVKESNLLVQSNWWHGFFECVLQILGTEVSTQLLSFRPLVTKTCSRITNLILP